MGVLYTAEAEKDWSCWESMMLTKNGSTKCANKATPWYTSCYQLIHTSQECTLTNVWPWCFSNKSLTVILLLFPLLSNPEWRVKDVHVLLNLILKRFKWMLYSVEAFRWLVNERLSSVSLDKQIVPRVVLEGFPLDMLLQSEERQQAIDLIASECKYVLSSPNFLASSALLSELLHWLACYASFCICRHCQ